MNEPASPQEPAAATTPPTCKWDLYPDGHRCPRAPAASAGPHGPGRDYCEQADGPGEPVHNPANAWRARQRLRAAAQASRAEDASAGRPAPTMTTARLKGTELLQSARVHADRLETLGIALREVLAVATDPAAAEAEIEEIQAAADQRVQAAEQRVGQAVERAAAAETFAEAANAAAEQMSEELDAARRAAADADTARQETDRQAAAAREEARRQVASAREEADTQVSVIREETARAIEQASEEAAELIRRARGERDRAVQGAAQAEVAARLAQQEAAGANTAATSAREELARYRDDTEKMLTQSRTDAERERDQIRADWQGRAQRDADEIGRLRRELDQIRAAAGDHEAAKSTLPAPRTRGGPRQPPAGKRKDRA